MKGIKSALSGIQEGLTGISMPKLPTLGRQVPIPVYMVHNSDHPDDYFFIFDFEEFVEKSRDGMFVRPKIKLFAGRDDFNRGAFARQFRVSFAKQFDAARDTLVAQKKQGGWFGWLSETASEISGSNLQAFAAHVVLLVSLSAGKMVLSAILPARFFSGRSSAQKLEESIEDTKVKVDLALERLEVVLHWELCAHAFYGDQPEGFREEDYDTWPLPEYVKEHLDDKETGAFW